MCLSEPEFEPQSIAYDAEALTLGYEARSFKICLVEKDLSAILTFRKKRIFMFDLE